MDRVVVYTQTGCKQSDKVKQLLSSKKVTFIEKDISYDVLLKREMIERSGGKAITPQVFFNNSHIKSLDALAEAIDQSDTKAA